MRSVLLPAALLALALSAPISVQAQTAQNQAGKVSHALTLGDAPKYPAGFKQLDYVNVNAPKGGEIKMSHPGGFDSLMPMRPRSRRRCSNASKRARSSRHGA